MRLTPSSTASTTLSRRPKTDRRDFDRGPENDVVASADEVDEPDPQVRARWGLENDATPWSSDWRCSRVSSERRRAAGRRAADDDDNRGGSLPLHGPDGVAVRRRRRRGPHPLIDAARRRAAVWNGAS